MPDVTNSRVSRLLLSFNTFWAGSSLDVAQDPTGCIVALSPVDGSVLDSYCVPRDVTSYFATTNYLATAPIVALNARGPGAHTAIVAQFDIIVFAFDALALAQGPLYAVDPFPDAKKEASTISTDYLAITKGGSIICQGWDDTKNEYTVFAIPGFLRYAPTNGGGGGAAASSAGKTAAVTIGILLGLGGAVGGFVWWAGGGAAALVLVKSTLSGLMGGGGGGGVGAGASKGFGSAYNAVSSSGLSAASASAGSGAKAAFAAGGSGGYGSL